MFNEIPILVKTFCTAVITAAPKVTTGIILFIIIWIAAVITKFFIVHYGSKSKNRKYLYQLIGSVAKIFIIVAGAISALGTMGINVSALVASLGLAGFALGFALKDSISNLLAGFMLLFYKPFIVGDQIKLKDVAGQVMDINLRYTVVKTDSQRTLVPNSTLLTVPVTVIEKSEMMTDKVAE